MTNQNIAPTTVSALRNGRRMPAPATYRLYIAGGCLSNVARRLGVTPQAVSLWLNGRTPPPRRLRRALVAIVGVEAADAVIALIPERITA